MNNYRFQWHYDKNPDLSGNQTIMYYNFNNDKVCLFPNKNIFNQIIDIDPSTSYEKECKYIQDLINKYGEIVYIYVQENIDMNDINCFWNHNLLLYDNDNIGDYFMFKFYSEAVEYIKDELIDIPKKFLDMLKNLTDGISEMTNYVIKKE